RRDANNHVLRRRRVARLGNALQRNEYVGLGKISRRAASGNVIRHDEKMPGNAGLTLEVAGQVDRLAGREAQVTDVAGIHEHHAALVVDAPVAILQAVDGRIELVVAADRGHYQLPGLQMMCGQWMNREVRLSGLSQETPFSGMIWQIEPAGLADPLVVLIETGNDSQI